MIKSDKSLNRRQLLKLLGVGAGGALLAACGAQPTPAAPAPAAEAPKPTEAPKEEPKPTEAPKEEAKPTEAPKAEAPAAANIRALPADAAPKEHQVAVFTGALPYTYLDATLSIYNAQVGANLHNIPMISFNHDFEVLPRAAKSWKVDDKGTTWTFSLRDDIKWTDGKALNAEDFVSAMQVIVDPKWAHDFNWYYGETKLVNFAECTKGEKPVTDVGAKQGANEFEVIMETTSPVPYLPLMLPYLTATHAKFVRDANGEVNKAYNLDPATAVSCGPFVLKVNTPDRVVHEANRNLPTDLQPYLEKMVHVVIPVEQAFQAYQSGQIDHMQLIQTADIQATLADEKLKAEVQPDVGDFRCDYMFFDISKAPFDNLKFRQAISHLVNRDAIIENITTPLASKPAFGFLAPGFPGHNPELKSIQNYDPELAKKLYAESGVKVDKLLLEVRSNDGETRRTIGEFIGATIKEHLAIDVEVAFVDQKIFMDKLNKKPTEITFGMISYGMDYLDQSNMLSVFRKGGRHNWNNDEYQKLLDDAGPEADKAKRDEMYKKAEQLLAESCYAVFIAFRTVPKLTKPYVAGESLKAGKFNTVPGLPWPDRDSLAIHQIEMYMNKSVVDARPTPPA
jgi:peptide/nickel transport system substrate-binding protein/oligopeptide transport system substrate-binding protein